MMTRFIRAQGRTLGRPDGFALHGPVLARMNAEGYSQGRMSREMKTGFMLAS